MKKSEDNNKEELSEIFINAEKSVQGIKDPKLKEIAFAKALDILMNDQAGSTKAKGKMKGKSPVVKSSRTSQKPPIRKDGPLSWVRELAEESFFKEPKSSSDILTELSNRSHRLKHTDITLPLQTLSHEKILRRNKQKSADGGKAVFHWYNW